VGCGRYKREVRLALLDGDVTGMAEMYEVRVSASREYLQCSRAGSSAAKKRTCAFTKSVTAEEGLWLRSVETDDQMFLTDEAFAHTSL
jgi:hypothetical protein